MAWDRVSPLGSRTISRWRWHRTTISRRSWCMAIRSGDELLPHPLCARTVRARPEARKRCFSAITRAGTFLPAQCQPRRVTRDVRDSSKAARTACNRPLLNASCSRCQRCDEHVMLIKVQSLMMCAPVLTRCSWSRHRPGPAPAARCRSPPGTARRSVIGRQVQQPEGDRRQQPRSNTAALRLSPTWHGDTTAAPGNGRIVISSVPSICRPTLRSSSPARAFEVGRTGDSGIGQWTVPSLEQRADRHRDDDVEDGKAEHQQHVTRGPSGGRSRPSVPALPSPARATGSPTKAAATQPAAQNSILER